ncbi:hypothetical protein [Hwangdonia sp.]|uniref:hypothetical protein n=1 Tax=Hwangdonia sp. TaxID=1883432 RepID=UPI003AB1F581
MKKNLTLLIVLLVSLSCSNSKKKKSTIIESRYLYSSTLDSIKMRTEFKLVKTITDTLIHYKYKSESDSTRNFEIYYKLKTESLFLNSEEYKIFKENSLQYLENPEVWFDDYRMAEPIIDGIEPIMFNSEYGILAITGALNPTHFFLAKKNDTLIVKKILERLY